MNQPAHNDRLMAELRRVARRAGQVIMECYRGNPVARAKQDNSPVTAADEMAERLILAALRALMPDVPIVSEEAAAKRQG